MITSQVSTVTYIGDGIATEFPVPFPFLEAENLVVTAVFAGVSSIYALNVQYTVDEEETVGVYGTLIFAVAPVNGTELIVTRAIPVTQEVDYQVSDRFHPDTVERSLDKLTLLIQQQSAVASRAIQFPDTEPEPIQSVLPAKNLRVNTVLGFDENGNLRLYTPAELSDASSGAADTYETIEIAGDFTVDVAHRNRSIHSTDLPVPQATNTITLPDPATMPPGFFLSVVKADTADLAFLSPGVINSEVVPPVIRRENAGVVIYIHNAQWWVVGAFGDSYPPGDTIVNTTQNSGIHLSGTAPTSPYVGQPWTDISANRALKIWDGTQWQLATPLVEHALFVAGEFPIRKVTSKPPLPDANWPIDSVILFQGGLWVNASNTWINTAVSGATMLLAGSTVVHPADLSRPAPLVGSGFYTFPLISSAQLAINTEVPFTDNALIISGWTNGIANLINNRTVNALSRLRVNLEYRCTIGGALEIQIAYRTRLTEAGAWSALTKVHSTNLKRVVNEPGFDQSLDTLAWSGEIATPSQTDVQFVAVWKRTSGTCDVNFSRMSVLVFNL